MVQVNNEFYKEIRCTKCRKLLAHEYIFAGRILIKCYHCGEFNKIVYRTPSKLIEKIILQDDRTFNPDEEIIISRKVNISDLTEGVNTNNGNSDKHQNRNM